MAYDLNTLDLLQQRVLRVGATWRIETYNKLTSEIVDTFDLAGADDNNPTSLLADVARRRLVELAMYGEGGAAGLSSLVTGTGVPFASLPAASLGPRVVFVSDVGVHGSLWRSDGTTWGIVGGSCILGQSGVAVSVTAASVAEEVLANVALPAGVMGINGALRISLLVSVTNNANNKTLRARLGSTALGGSAFVAITNASVASIDPIPQVIRNRGVANSQVTFVAANGHVAATSGTANTTFTEDTSQPMVVSITGQKATGSDTFTLEGYTLELIRP